MSAQSLNEPPPQWQQKNRLERSWDFVSTGGAADSAGSSLAKGLTSTDQGDWQDASASLDDYALQAAVADGVVSFVHAAAGLQGKLQQDVVPGRHVEGSTSIDQDDVVSDDYLSSKENETPAAATENTVDDVACLELE